MSRGKKRDNRTPLTSGEAARQLGVCVATVQSYFKRGVLQGFQLPGGDLQIEPGSIDAIKCARAPRSAARQ